MVGRENLRSFGVNLPIADADLIHPVHQLRNEIKSEAGAAKGLDATFRCDDHLGVFDGVIEVVSFHCGQDRAWRRYYNASERFARLKPERHRLLPSAPPAVDLRA